MPNRSARIVLSVWILFWVLMATVQLQEYIKSGRTRYWEPVLWEASSAVVITALLLAQRRLMHRYDHLLDKPFRWFLLQLMWLPLFWICFTPLAYGIRLAAYAVLGESYSHPLWLQVFVYESVRLTLFNSIFAVVLFGILSYQAMLREKEQAGAAGRLLRETQLHGLTQQIRPHFLFNALNTVSQLMYVDVSKADAVLAQLADLLRATLDISERTEAALATELHLARGYARLMCERFAERVEMTWDIDPLCETCNVPVMSLQPLLENIFKHTVEQRRQKTHILIVTRREHDELVVRLEDDLGVIAPSDGNGIGLRNLRARLHALHGNKASLTVTQLTPAGVRAEMRLPCAC